MRKVETTKISVLMTGIENGIINFEHKAQRPAGVWSNSMKSRLIYSLLAEREVQSLTMTVHGNTRYVLDGKQRLTTIYSFINNKYPLRNLPLIYNDFTGQEVNVNGMTYGDLPQEFKERILNYEIGVSYFTEIDFDKEKTIFEDVNSSKKVSEWILARNTNDRSADISELESHGIFSYLTDAGLASAVNTKVVAKTFLMLYSTDIKNFDAKTARKVFSNSQLTDEEINGVKALFDKYAEVKEYINNLYTRNKEYSKKINFASKKMETNARMVDILYGVNKLIRRGYSIKIAADWIVEFFGTNKPSISEEYNSGCTRGTAGKINVVKRFNAIDKSLEDFVDNKY